MPDAYSPQDIDSFVATVRATPNDGAFYLRMRPDGFAKAYSAISTHKDSRGAAHICYDNPINNILYAA